jgi:hypothetical protein
MINRCDLMQQQKSKFFFVKNVETVINRSYRNDEDEEEDANGDYIQLK